MRNREGAYVKGNHSYIKDKEGNFIGNERVEWIGKGMDFCNTETRLHILYNLKNEFDLFLKNNERVFDLDKIVYVTMRLEEERRKAGNEDLGKIRYDNKYNESVKDKERLFNELKEEYEKRKKAEAEG
jgi:hypothetical protein